MEQGAEQKLNDLRNLMEKTLRLLDEKQAVCAQQKAGFDKMKEEFKVVDREIRPLRKKMKRIKGRSKIQKAQEVKELQNMINDQIERKLKLLEQQRLDETSKKLDENFEETKKSMLEIHRIYTEIRHLSLPSVDKELRLFVNKAEGLCADMRGLFLSMDD